VPLAAMSGATMRATDYSLYLVTDRPLCRGRSLLEVVEAAVRGGATVVQLREKHCPTGEFILLARQLKRLLQGSGVVLIINDRLDVALAAGADGVHLGQQDMAIADARRLAGPSLIIGVSAESLEDALRAEMEGADYIGISPVFATTTKKDAAEPLGLDGVRQIRAAVRLPLVGIGGINVDNVAFVIAAGADGAAVVSAIVAAESPEQAARALKKRIVSAKEDKSL
jgi:thiamine-phosphate pyrophosphorylase